MIIPSTLGILIGSAISFILVFALRRSKIKEASIMADKLLENAHSEARLIEEQAKGKAKDIVLKSREDLDNEVKNFRRENQKIEHRLQAKEDTLEKKIQKLNDRERNLMQIEKSFETRHEELEKSIKRYKDLADQMDGKLSEAARLPIEEAKTELFHSLMEKVKLENASTLKKSIEETKETSEKEAKRILSIAMQRQASDYTADSTTSSVNLTNEEMKGRIIGKEGRNIRAIEAATGVDLIIDDTPEVIIVSSFDPVRREIARLSLERLMQDGRINPARIEEIVNKVSKEVESIIRDKGEKACIELGLTGIHPEIQKLIGTLNFRTSYGQNQYYHSIEVGFLCGSMGAELGIPVKIARRAGLLHDIGKALDHSMEGTHAIIGSDMAQKFGEKPNIVHAIRAHHEEVKPNSILDFLVMTADAISGARPGARREIVQNFQSRMKELEDIANGFEGVDRSFAIQAGREIRVLVDASKVSDELSVVLSQDIAKKIENDLTYPGQVKVTVIRETRAVGLAK